MAEVPFRVWNPDGTPNITLVKSNVNFKTYSGNTWGSYISYSGFTKQNNEGNYTASGITGWQYCGLYIDDVWQTWFGMQWIGEPDSYFMDLSNNQTVVGTKLFSGTLQVAILSETGSGIGINITGQLKQNLDPISPYDLTNKTYIDNKINSVTGALTGYLALSSNNIQYVNSIASFENFVVFDNASAPFCYSNPDTDNSLTRKKYVDDSITSCLVLSSSNTQYVDSMTVFKNIVSFTPLDMSPRIPPICSCPPTNNWHLSNKGYIDSEITTRINTMGSGAYQESQNIIRIIPNGTTTGSVYASWSEGITYANANATSNKNITAIIPGNGTAGGVIGMSVKPKDYVHVKASGAGVKIAPDTTGLSAGAVGRIVYDGFELYMNDSENPFIYTNIRFQNIIFNCIDATELTLYNCDFGEGVEFKGNIVPSIVNGTGERITSVLTPIITGTNKIQYSTATELSVGTGIITDNGTNFKINRGLSADTINAKGIYASEELSSDGLDVNGTTNTGDLNVSGNSVLNSITASDLKMTNDILGKDIYLTKTLTAGNVASLSANFSSATASNFYVSGTTNVNTFNANSIVGNITTSRFINTMRTIEHSNSTGFMGEMYYDHDFEFRCIDIDTWIRQNHTNGQWESVF